VQVTPAKEHKGNPTRLIERCQNLTGVEALRATDLTVEPDGPTFAVRAHWHAPRIARLRPEYLQPKRARQALEASLGSGCCSKSPAFVPLSRTVRKHKEGILAYIKQRYTNAIVDAFKNRFRMIARRAYGFHSAEALQAMILFSCGDIQIGQPLP